MTEICPICEDSGLRLIIQPDGERYAQPCECRLQLQAARLLKRAAIPKRYEHCTLDTFEPDYRPGRPVVVRSLYDGAQFRRRLSGDYRREGAPAHRETWAPERPTWRLVLFRP